MSRKNISSYFDEKIHKIRVNLDWQAANSVFGRTEEAGTPTYSSNLVTFKVATEKEVSEVIKKSATRPCTLCSQNWWIYPWERAVYHHHLKRLSWFHYWEKSTLNPEVMKKYRPVSNLPFVSKVLERAVLRRILNHLDVTNHHEPHQPVYRLLHSTETALVRVCNDILLSLD